MIDKDVIDYAVNHKFSKFSDSIKQELKTKLDEHPVMVDYKNEIAKIKDTQSDFSNIVDKLKV